MNYQCSHCGGEVELKFAFNKQILAGGDLSRQGFHENRELLDSVGTLFNQYLHHEIDVNGFEIYYLSAPQGAGALLDVAYYRCPHCEAQYLVLNKERFKEERPPFEPDEISIKRIVQVELDHGNFIQSFRAESMDVSN